MSFNLKYRMYKTCRYCYKQFRVHNDLSRQEKSCQSDSCRGVRHKCARDFSECLVKVGGLLEDDNLAFTHFMIGDNVDGLEMLISKIDEIEKTPSVDSWKLKGDILRRMFLDVKDCKSLIMGIAMARNFTEEKGQLKMMRRAMEEIENILSRVKGKSCSRRVMLPIIKEHFDALMKELENLKVLQAIIEKNIRQECPDNEHIINTLSYTQEQAKKNLQQHEAEKLKLLEENNRLIKLLEQIDVVISDERTFIKIINCDIEDYYDQRSEE